MSLTQCFEVMNVRDNDKKYEIDVSQKYLQQIKCPAGFEFKFYENDLCIAESKNGIYNFATFDNERDIDRYLNEKIPYKYINSKYYYIQVTNNCRPLSSHNKISILFTFANIIENKKFII